MSVRLISDEPRQEATVNLPYDAAESLKRILETILHTKAFSIKVAKVDIYVKEFNNTKIKSERN